MKRFVKNNDNSVYANLISIFIIFFMFTVLSLTLILITTDSYKKMKNQIDNTFNSSALLSYVTNKIRSYDNKDNTIRVIKEDGVDNVLRLEDGNEKLVTYIYEKNDIVYESVARKGDKLNCNMGQELFKAKKVTFKICDENLIKITIHTTNNKNMYNYVNIKTMSLK